MKKGRFFVYIILLLTLLLSALVIWPNSWVNIDVGDFHYHKLWEGPSLSQISFGLLDNDLDIRLGKEFTGTSKYRLQVAFPQSESATSDSPLQSAPFSQQSVKIQIDKQESVKKAVDLMRERMKRAGLTEAVVWAEETDEGYFINVDTGLPKQKADKHKATLFGKGLFELWYPKPQQEQGGQQASPTGSSMRDMLSQSYQNTGVNLEDIKGYKVDEGENGAFVKIGLLQDQSTNLTTTLYQAQSQFIGLLDERYLLIDTNELREQLSFYREIKSLKLAGMQTQLDARIVAAVISTESLPVSLTEADVEEIPAVYSSEFVKFGALVLTFSIVIASGVCLYLYKHESVFAVSSFGFFLVVFGALLKIVPITFTSISIVSAILMGCLFAVLLFVYLEEARKIHGEAKTFSLTFVKSETFRDTVARLGFVLVGLTVLAILFGPWQAKNISWVILMGTVAAIFVKEVVLPFSYKFAKSIKSEKAQ